MGRVPTLPNTYALVVNGSPKGVSVPLLNALVEGANLIVACDSGAESLVAAGRYPDLLVGDLDSISAGARSACEDAGVTFETIPVRKDISDFRHALDILRNRDVSDVIICATTGGRLDQTIAAVGELAQACDLCPIVVDDDEVIVTVEPKYRPSVRLADLGLSVGDAFSVFALEPRTRITEQGVSYPTEDAEFEPFSSLGLSNVMTAEDAVVTCDNGLAIIVVSTLT